MYPALEKSTAGFGIFSLPGHGVPGKGCGDPVPYYCRTHEGGFWVSSHCNERTCPRCSERWGKKAARKASLRVAWGAKVVTQQRRAAGVDERPRLVHGMVSMPELEGWGVPEYRQACYSICLDHKIIGGLAVIHPFRKDDYDSEYVPDGHVHFHVIGLNFEDMPPGGGDYVNGQLVIFKVIRDAEYGDYRGFRSGLAIEREVQYLLSHAGVADGFHTLTYFGALAYNKLPESAVNAYFPDCLVDENPGVQCPVEGSLDTEPCAELDFVRTPSLRVPSIYDNVRSRPVELPVQPFPEHDPSPEVIRDRETAIREDCEYLYQCEHDYRERLKIRQDRQERLNKLARDEVLYLNWNDPLVRIWAAIRALLTNDRLSRDEILERIRCEPLDGFPNPVNATLDLNLRTGRLEETPGGRLSLAGQYGLQGALDDMRYMWFDREATGDWRLERMLRANPPAEPEILTDMGFVFGGILERYQAQIGGTQ